MGEYKVATNGQTYRDKKAILGKKENLTYLKTNLPARFSWVTFKIIKYCIRTLPRGGMYWEIHPRGPRDFPRAWILHPEAREISRGRSPREISRAEGCKIHARGKSRGPRGMYFPMHPDSRQCTSILSALAGKY